MGRQKKKKNDVSEKMDESSLGRNNNSLSDEKTPVVMQIEVIDVSDDEQTVKFKSNYSKNENQRV